jgi:hypothetical protein
MHDRIDAGERFLPTRIASEITDCHVLGGSGGRRLDGSSRGTN